MEIKVTIGFDKQAAEILNRLIEVLGQKKVITEVVPKEEEKTPELIIQPELVVPTTPVQETPAQVPTSAPSYTLADLQKSAGELVNAGKADALLGILKEFGVAALTMLPEDKYGEFALKLRELGGNI